MINIRHLQSEDNKPGCNYKYTDEAARYIRDASIMYMEKLSKEINCKLSYREDSSKKQIIIQIEQFFTNRVIIDDIIEVTVINDVEDTNTLNFELSYILGEIRTMILVSTVLNPIKPRV